MVKTAKESLPWTREFKKIINKSDQETDMRFKQKIAAVNTCLRATHSKMAMIDVLYVTKDTTPESVSQNNQTAGYDLSHLSMTEDTIAIT